MNFKTQNITVGQQTAVVVEIQTEEGEVLSPQQLSNLQPPDVSGTQGVIISGRAPIWVYAHLVHWYHPTRWIATFDPRLGGGVVVCRHHYTAPNLGDVVPIN